MRNVSHASVPSQSQMLRIGSDWLANSRRGRPPACTRRVAAAALPAYAARAADRGGSLQGPVKACVQVRLDGGLRLRTNPCGRRFRRRARMPTDRPNRLKTVLQASNRARRALCLHTPEPTPMSWLKDINHSRRHGRHSRSAQREHLRFAQYQPRRWQQEHTLTVPRALGLQHTVAGTHARLAKAQPATARCAAFTASATRTSQVQLK